MPLGIHSIHFDGTKCVWIFYCIFHRTNRSQIIERKAGLGDYEVFIHLKLGEYFCAAGVIWTVWMKGWVRVDEHQPLVMI